MARPCREDDERAREGDALLAEYRTFEPPRQWRSGNFRILVTLLAMATLNSLTLQILIPAEIRIFESIYCKDWFETHEASVGSGLVGLLSDGGIDEHYCKIPPVQKQVSSLRGYIEWWDALPALFVAIPIGILADQVGRRWLLRLGMVVIFLKQLWTGLVCATNMPLERIYLVSLLNLLSGNHSVVDMVFFVVMVDVTPRQSLPIVFFVNNALGQTCKVAGPAITGILMRFSPWYSFFCGILILFVACIASFTVSETHPSTVSSKPDTQDSLEAARVRIFERIENLRSAYVISLRELLTIWNDWRLLFVLLLVPPRVMAGALEELAQRYVSYRFHWTLGDAAFLHSIQALFAAFILFFILPWISTKMDTEGINAIRKNTILAESSLALTAIALFVQGIAPTVQLLIFGFIIETSGSGVPASTRALASALTEEEDSGRVFSGLATAELLSFMTVYPLAAFLFNVGIEKVGNLWLGLPFYSTAVVIGLVALVMCLLPFERPMVPVTIADTRNEI